jgi:hypothetical protein
VNLDYGTVTTKSYEIDSRFSPFKNFNIAINNNTSIKHINKTKTNQDEKNLRLEINSGYNYTKLEKIKLNKLDCKYNTQENEVLYRNKENEDKLDRSRDYSLDTSIKFLPVSFLSNEFNFFIKESFLKNKKGTITDPSFKPTTLEAKFDISNINLQHKYFSIRTDINNSYREDYSSGLGKLPEVKDIVSAQRVETKVSLKDVIVDKLTQRMSLLPISKSLKPKINHISMGFTMELAANYKNISTSILPERLISLIYKDFYKGKLFHKKLNDNNLSEYREKADNKRSYWLNSGGILGDIFNTEFKYSYGIEDLQQKVSKSLNKSSSYEIDLNAPLLKVLAFAGKFYPWFKKRIKEGATCNFKYNYKKSKNLITSAEETTQELSPSASWGIPTKNPKLSLNADYSYTYKINKKTQPASESIDKNINLSLTADYKVDKEASLVLPIIRKRIDLRRVVSINTSFRYNSSASITNRNYTKNSGDYTFSVGSTQQLGENTQGNFSLNFKFYKDRKDKSNDFIEYSAAYKLTFTF